VEMVHDQPGNVDRQHRTQQGWQAQEPYLADTHEFRGVCCIVAAGL
jgi:hypothetical protein